MYFLQTIIAVAIILISIQEGFQIHKEIMISFLKRQMIFRGMTRGLHRPKSRILREYSRHPRILVKVRLKKKSNSRALIKVKMKGLKKEFNFKGFLSNVL